MDDKIVLWGKKVRVRSMREEDVEKMIHWPLHEDLLFYDYNFPYMDKEERQDWFETKTKGLKRCFSVFDRQGQMVGYISLRNVNWLFKRAEMGIVFNPDRLSKGYGSEAISILLRWYFKELKYKKMILTVAAYNERAMRSYEKVGFQKYSQHFGEFMNPKVNPLEDEEYKHIRKYFRKKRKMIEVLYYKMKISTLSTE